MASLSTLLTILLLVLIPIISAWNAYASGINIGRIRKNNIQGFSKYAAYSGLGLAFVGMTYFLLIVISVLAYGLGYIDASTVNVALSVDFLVFALLIIVFGIMVTIQSVIVAYQRRNFMSIFIAAYNIFAVIWDIYAYASGFRQAASVVANSTRKNRGNVFVLVVAAVLIGYFVTHELYKKGLQKAMNEQPGQGGNRGQMRTAWGGGTTNT